MKKLICKIFGHNTYVDIIKRNTPQSPQLLAIVCVRCNKVVEHLRINNN